MIILSIALLHISYCNTGSINGIICFVCVLCLVNLELTKEVAEVEAVVEGKHSLKERKQICHSHTNCKSSK